MIVCCPCVSPSLRDAKLKSVMSQYGRWCGGMHVLDLGIILALCALGAIWTEQLSIGYFRYIDCRPHLLAAHASWAHCRL